MELYYETDGSAGLQFYCEPALRPMRSQSKICAVVPEVEGGEGSVTATMSLLSGCKKLDRQEAGKVLSAFRATVFGTFIEAQGEKIIAHAKSSYGGNCSLWDSEGKRAINTIEDFVSVIKKNTLAVAEAAELVESTRRAQSGKVKSKKGNGTSTRIFTVEKLRKMKLLKCISLRCTDGDCSYLRKEGKAYVVEAQWSHASTYKKHYENYHSGMQKADGKKVARLTDIWTSGVVDVQMRKDALAAGGSSSGTVHDMYDDTLVAVGDNPAVPLSRVGDDNRAVRHDEDGDDDVDDDDDDDDDDEGNRGRYESHHRTGNGRRKTGSNARGSASSSGAQIVDADAVVDVSADAVGVKALAMSLSLSMHVAGGEWNAFLMDACLKSPYINLDEERKMVVLRTHSYFGLEAGKRGLSVSGKVEGERKSAAQLFEDHEFSFMKPHGTVKISSLDFMVLPISIDGHFSCAAPIIPPAGQSVGYILHADTVVRDVGSGERYHNSQEVASVIGDFIARKITRERAEEGADEGSAETSCMLSFVPVILDVPLQKSAGNACGPAAQLIMRLMAEKSDIQKLRSTSQGSEGFALVNKGELSEMCGLGGLTCDDYEANRVAVRKQYMTLTSKGSE
jgi:hypothetical protein